MVDIVDRKVIDKIMQHLRQPLLPEVLADGAVVYDITAPSEWDGIDSLGTLCRPRAGQAPVVRGFALPTRR